MLEVEGFASAASKFHYTNVKAVMANNEDETLITVFRGGRSEARARALAYRNTPTKRVIPS